MGIVVQQVMFDAPAPTAATIAARVTDLVGLPVVVRESPTESRGTLFDLLAHIAFEIYPKAEIELYTYRAGAVQEHLHLSGMDALPLTSVVQGSDEPVGKQTVYLKGYVGQEPTLLFATTLALEALGGRIGRPMPDDLRRKYGRVTSADELGRRHRRVQRQGLLLLSGGVLLLPILVPVWIVTIVWHMITLPRRIRKAQQLVNNHFSDHPPGGA